MIAKLTLSVAALTAALIAGQAMAQTAQQPVRPPGAVTAPPAPGTPGAVPQVNPTAFRAIPQIRQQWEQARAQYLQAQQAELTARANYDRATTALLNVLSASSSQPPTQPMPQVGLLPGQPGQPAPQPPRPTTGAPATPPRP